MVVVRAAYFAISATKCLLVVNKLGNSCKTQQRLLQIWLSKFSPKYHGNCGLKTSNGHVENTFEDGCCHELLMKGIGLFGASS
jgi:hypothetical protein